MDFVENRTPNNIYETKFYDFVLENYHKELMDILSKPNPAAHFPLEIFFLSLPTKLAEKIALSPDTVLPAVQQAALRALTDIYLKLDDKTGFVPKKHIHVRFLSMVEGTSIYRTVLPGCKDLNKFFALVGTIVRTSQPKLLEFKKFYRCNKCKNSMVVEAVDSRYYRFPLVDKCDNLCVGAKIEPFDPGEGSSNNSSVYARVKDYQEVKLQEQISSRSGFGSVPKALWVILEDDLVDSCKPGDDVVITGTLFLRYKPFRKDQLIDAELTFKANHVEVKNDQRASVQIGPETVKRFTDFWSLHEKNPFVGRNAILRSICPHVYGMYVVKLAVCIVLAGGVEKENAGARVRGQSHLLLIGDPGTGKSQILKYVSKITPRSVFTTGAGTTSAGLTVAATKDSGEWHLEAGALVLADSGVCCIDEFSLIKEHDRVSIHEAMEQQSISVAKAGMVCKLKTKCTVIAATNPKLTKYDPSETLELNVGLASPLLSRFDLIIALRDAQNDSWDEFLSDFILNDVDVFDHHAKTALKTGLIWDSDVIQSYFVLIKEKDPDMTEDAHHVLSRYFQIQRNSANRNAARTTIRLLESLYRLAEGHARLMYREFVSVHDAITAVSLVEASMQSSALGQTQNLLHTAFPEDPLKEYYAQAKAILQMLDLPDLWEREKIYLDNMMQQGSRSSMPPPPPSQRPINPGSSSSSRKIAPSSSSKLPPSDSSPNVIPATQCSNSSPKQNIPLISKSSKILCQQRVEEDGSPELFPNEHDYDKYNQIPPAVNTEHVAFTSTQNNNNVGVISASLRRNDIRRNVDLGDAEILSPIPPIEYDDDQHPKTFGNLLRTPKQTPPSELGNNNPIDKQKQGGIKRKGNVSEDTTEVIKSTRTPPIQSATSTDSSKSNDDLSLNSFKNHSLHSLRKRFERLPNSQD